MPRPPHSSQEANRKFGTALGRMHETTLLVLLRATRYTLTTVQLLDFLRGDLTLALAVLQQLIACASYEDEVVACALSLLGGFCRPDTYIDFAHGIDGERSVSVFSDELDRFSAELLKSKLLLVAVPAIAQRAFGAAARSGAADRSLTSLSPGQTSCLHLFLRLVCDLSLLVHDAADGCRSDLAAASAAGSTLLLPLLRHLALAPPPPPPGYHPLDHPVPRMLPIALRTAALLCFRAPPAVASAVRASGVLCELLPHCLVEGRAGIRLGSLLLALACNVDALAPLGKEGLRVGEAECAAAEDLLAALQGRFEELHVGLVAELLTASESGTSSAEMVNLPVARQSTTARDLGEMMQQMLVSAQPAEADALVEQLRELELKAAHLESVQDELKGLADASLPSMESAFSQLAELEADLLENEAVAQQLADKLGMDLATAARGDEPPEGADPADPYGWRAQHLAAVEAEAAAGETSGAVMPASTRFRLLGDLPQLSARRQGAYRPGGSASGTQGTGADPPRRLKPRKRAKPPRPPDSGGGAETGVGGGEGPNLEPNVPGEFLCAINQHVMSKPVRSPQGFVFEAETIGAWLKEHGQICPMSGETLERDDLVSDEALKKRIQEHHIRTMLASQAKHDEERDMYDFD